MVEPILYASLGALIATLIGLMFLPVFWRRAVRLTTRQLVDKLPVSAGEIVAAQDRLRAELAMSLRQTERKAERAIGDATRDRVESARARSTELGHLADLADLRTKIAALESEGARIRGELDRSGVEAAAAFEALKEARAAADATARDLQAARQETSAARAETERARGETEARDREIAGLRGTTPPRQGAAPAMSAALGRLATQRPFIPALPKADTSFGALGGDEPLAPTPSPAATPLADAAMLAQLRKRLDEVADAIVAAGDAPAAQQTAPTPQTSASPRPKLPSAAGPAEPALAEPLVQRAGA